MSSQLRVTIDDNSGFCFGVVYAIEMAEDILDEEGHLYCLGDIVHNDEEIRRLEAKGLEIIDHNRLQTIFDAKVLIRAHGEPPSTYELALRNNIELIDASCPVVLKLQHRIKNSYDRGDKLLIYGKHGHAEVVGLLGQTNQEALVFQDFEEIDTSILPERVTLYSQTTKSTQSFYQIKGRLQGLGVQVDANDTICRQVSNRDAELRSFAAQFDKVVFVAGKKSSNGKVLYNVCKDVNASTWFISSADELQADWFTPGESIGVCGATSTPMWLMEQVKHRLETF